MSIETSITTVGNLTSDPDLRYTSGSTPVATFTVASTPRRFNREDGSWADGQTVFLRCVAWRDTAEHVHESLSKGDRVMVTGRLRATSYTNEQGERRTGVEVQVDEVGPSLRYATARPTRVSRIAADPPAGEDITSVPEHGATPTD